MFVARLVLAIERTLERRHSIDVTPAVQQTKRFRVAHRREHGRGARALAQKAQSHEWSRASAGVRWAHDAIVPIPELEQRARDLLFRHRRRRRAALVRSQWQHYGDWLGSRRERSRRILAFPLRVVRETQKQ